MQNRQRAGRLEFYREASFGHHSKVTFHTTNFTNYFSHVSHLSLFKDERMEEKSVLKLKKFTINEDVEILPIENLTMANDAEVKISTCSLILFKKLLEVSAPYPGIKIRLEPEYENSTRNNKLL